MNRKTKILSLFLALLLLLSTLSGCTGYLDPLGYLKDATLETIKSTLLGEILSLWLDTSSEGMFSLEFGGTDLIQGLPEAARMDLWVDVEDMKVAASGQMTLAGEKYDLAAYLNENEMAVVSSAFLGSNTLGVDFLTLKNDLKTSIFSNNSGTVFSDPSVSSASADRVQQIKSNFFKMLAYQEDTIDFVDEVVNVFLEELTSYAENARYTENGYTHISITVNNDSLARTLRATRAALVKDTSFSNYLKDVGNMLDALVSATTGVATTEYSTKVRYFLSSEADIDVLCQKIDDADPFVLRVKAAVKSFGMSLEDVGVVFEQGGVTRLDAKMHLDDDVFSLNVALDGVARHLTYQVSEDGFSSYRAALTYTKSVSGAPVVEVTGDLQANKRSDTYSLTLQKGNETRVFGGSYCFDSDEMMLSVDSASINGEEKRISLKISAVAEESVPDMPDYVNVAAMDVTRFTPIYDRANKTRDRLLADWESKALSPDGVLRDLLGAIGLPEEIPTSD